MRKLDDLIDAYYKSSGVSDPRARAGARILLKLDVQGYELEVLKGARETLSSVEVIILETSVLSWNAGSPLVAEVMGAMHTIGFRVLDLIERHGWGQSDQTLQLDFAFARSDSVLFAAAAAETGVILGPGRRRRV